MNKIEIGKLYICKLDTKGYTNGNDLDVLDKIVIPYQQTIVLDHNRFKVFSIEDGDFVRTVLYASELRELEED